MAIRIRKLAVATAIVALFVAAFAVAPQSVKGRVFSALVSESGIGIESGVSYGLEARYLLDVYRPANRKQPDAIVVFIHGGSWRTGDRRIYGFVGAALADRGIATVIPDYRLYPETRFPGFVEDAALAYRWAAEHFGASGKPIFLMGHSAGAHIAALLAYDRRYLSKAGATVRPAGFIGLAGPYAFNPKTRPDTADIFSTAPTADEARPVAFVQPGAPPALLLHGLDDTVVGLWNANALAEALAAKGVAAHKIELPGIGHVGIMLAMSRPFRWRAPVLDEIVRFVATRN